MEGRGAARPPNILNTILFIVNCNECLIIIPPRFLAECCKRQLNQGSFVLLYLRLSTFADLY